MSTKFFRIKYEKKHKIPKIIDFFCKKEKSKKNSEKNEEKKICYKKIWDPCVSFSWAPPPQRIEQRIATNHDLPLPENKINKQIMFVVTAIVFLLLTWSLCFSYLHSYKNHGCSKKNHENSAFLTWNL
jgi:hypothetical protein